MCKRVTMSSLAIGVFLGCTAAPDERPELPPPAEEPIARHPATEAIPPFGAETGTGMAPSPEQPQDFREPQQRQEIQRTTSITIGHTILRRMAPFEAEARVVGTAVVDRDGRAIVVRVAASLPEGRYGVHFLHDPTPCEELDFGLRTGGEGSVSAVLKARHVEKLGTFEVEPGEARTAFEAPVKGMDLEDIVREAAARPILIAREDTPEPLVACGNVDVTGMAPVG